jgi:ATP/maltotriose-dependent transcriptional regulator MalT
LPADVKRRRPRLLLQHAQALALTGRPDAATPLVHAAERAAEATGTDRPFLLGYASAVHAWVARLREDAPEAVALARRALALLPDEATHLRTFAAVCLGDALRSTGDLPAADEALALLAAGEARIWSGC